MCFVTAPCNPVVTATGLSRRGKRRRAELDLIRWFEYCLQVLLNNKQYFALSSMTSQNIRDQDRI